jgi:hypothetical protein
MTDRPKALTQALFFIRDNNDDPELPSFMNNVTLSLRLAFEKFPHKKKEAFERDVEGGMPAMEWLVHHYHLNYAPALAAFLVKQGASVFDGSGQPLRNRLQKFDLGKRIMMERVLWEAEEQARGDATQRTTIVTHQEEATNPVTGNPAPGAPAFLNSVSGTGRGKYLDHEEMVSFYHQIVSNDESLGPAMTIFSCSGCNKTAFLSPRIRRWDGWVSWARTVCDCARGLHRHEMAPAEYKEFLGPLASHLSADELKAIGRKYAERRRQLSELGTEKMRFLITPFSSSCPPSSS